MKEFDAMDYDSEEDAARAYNKMVEGQQEDELTTVKKELEQLKISYKYCRLREQCQEQQLKAITCVIDKDTEAKLDAMLGYELRSWHTSYKEAEQALGDMDMSDIPYGTQTGDDGTIDIEPDDEFAGIWWIMIN